MRTAVPWNQLPLMATGSARRDVPHGDARAAPYFPPMTKRPIPSLDLSRGMAGKMLVAMPHLDGTPFGQAVCLICSHDDDHAFGVIVNKPMDGLTVGELVRQLDIDAGGRSGEAQVFFGGPVGVERGAVLHSLDWQREETVAINGEIGLTATLEALEAIGTAPGGPRRWLLIMGHAGWHGGQLENEIKRNDWLSVDADLDLIFGQSSEAWSGALTTLGISDLGLFDGNESPVARPN